MTKQIRIENADTATKKVFVEVWDKGKRAIVGGELVKTIELSHPTQLISEHIWDTRYLVVRE